MFKQFFPRMMAVGLFALALTACGTTQTGVPAAQATAAPTVQPADAAMTEKPTDAAMMEKPTDAAMQSGEMSEKAAFLQVPLTDARTGKPFTLGDFAGKTVYVEPMATWCPNCKAQLSNVAAARQQLGDDTFVFVALSVETNLAPDELAQYADAAGFDWRFAVLTPDALKAFTATFGRTASNPPSTPHFLIMPDGTHTELQTGVEEADALVQRLKAMSDS